MPTLGTRKLKLDVDAVDFTDSVSDVRITADKKDTDFMSFAEAATGGAREYKLALTMKQDTASTALWYKIWTAAGTEVPVIIRPNGGTTASATEPHITGTVVISEPDGDLLGGEADDSATAVFTTEVEWTFTAKPTLVIV